MQHILLLISLSSLLFSLPLRYSLPESYYEVKHILSKSSRKSKDSIYISSTNLDYDIKKILNYAIKNNVSVKILHNNKKKTYDYEYYRLFKNTNIKTVSLKEKDSYIIFDEQYICYSPYSLLKKDNLDNEFEIICSDNQRIINKYIEKFKKDFQAN